MAKKLTKNKVRVGHLIKVFNQDKAKLSNAANTYTCVHVRDGKDQYSLLLTKTDLDRARSRAEKNPEDIPKLGWWAKMISK